MCFTICKIHSIWKREKKIAAGFCIVLRHLMNRMFVRIGQYIKGDTKFELVKNDLLSIVIQNNTPRLPVQLLQKICGKNEK